MTSSELLIGGMLGIIVAYPIGMRLLANAVQPFRLHMAELGRDMLDSGQLTPLQRHMVDSMLNDAYDPRVVIFFAIALPVFVVGKATGLIPDVDDDLLPSGKLRTDMVELSKLHTVAIAAANPFFSCFIMGEVAIIGIVAAPIAFVYYVVKGSFDLGNSFELNTFALNLSHKVFRQFVAH